MSDTLNPEEPKKKSRRGLMTGVGIALLFSLAGAIFFKNEFFTIQVTGKSMETTYHNGQRLLATRAYWLVGNIKRNDVVVVKSETPGEYLIKRVNRLGGETVDWLNVPDDHKLEAGTYTVPQNSVYVLGDNLPESADSREFGPVPLNRIMGKVVILK